MEDSETCPHACFAVLDRITSNSYARLEVPGGSMKEGNITRSRNGLSIWVIEVCNPVIRLMWHRHHLPPQSKSQSQVSHGFVSVFRIESNQPSAKATT